MYLMLLVPLTLKLPFFDFHDTIWSRLSMFRWPFPLSPSGVLVLHTPFLSAAFGFFPCSAPLRHSSWMTVVVMTTYKQITLKSLFLLRWGIRSKLLAVQLNLDILRALQVQIPLPILKFFISIDCTSSTYQKFKLETMVKASSQPWHYRYFGLDHSLLWGDCPVLCRMFSSILGL